MEIQTIQQKIHEIRGLRVLLDFDLAALYEVPNKALKQAVRRNMERFPPDFMIELSEEEAHFLRSQIVTLKNGRGKYSKYSPFAFTEQGVAMLSGILNSPKSIQMNIAIMRAFVELRHFSINYKDIAQKLIDLESSFGQEITDIHSALHWLSKENDSRRDEIDELTSENIDKETWKNRPLIGFKP
jgi:ORF6N domain